MVRSVAPAGPPARRWRNWAIGGWSAAGAMTAIAATLALLMVQPAAPVLGDQLVADHPQGIPDQDEVGVVGDEATGRTQVDDGPCDRGHIAEGVDVGHHIVPEPARSAAPPRRLG